LTRVGVVYGRPQGFYVRLRFYFIFLINYLLLINKKRGQSSETTADARVCGWWEGGGAHRLISFIWLLEKKNQQ
jgi:hypothetical protein